MKKTMILIIGLSIGSSIQANEHKPKVLAISFTKAGFFGCFFSVINNLRWCEKNNVIPVVNWGESSHYYEKEGWNGNQEPWEYYFEPVSNIKASDIPNFKGVAINKRIHAPDRTHIPSTQCRSKSFKKVLAKTYRKSINNTIRKFIRVKSEIIEKVDSFFEENMKALPTIGIHLRGTDKGSEVVPVPVKDICEAANTLAQGYDHYQFYLASDEEKLVKEAKTFLNGPVVCYDSFRSTDGKGIHWSKHSYNKAKLGEEVLIDALILSRCNKMVHTRSGVSVAALFFNPDLENKLIYDEQLCPL